MLTRCPACETHFRVTAEQLKARSGRVRCGQCQNVFNALDGLIEEPTVVIAPSTVEPPRQRLPASPSEVAAEAAAHSEGGLDERAVARPRSGIRVTQSGPAPAPYLPSRTFKSAEEAPEPSLAEPAEAAEPEAADPVAAAATGVTDGSETYPELPPPPRRWRWAIGSLVALTAIGLQAVLAFRVELAVIWPGAKPALVTLCDIANCEVGLPAKVALVGIEASDLHPDSEHAGRLTLTATLKNRAPFVQQFPHLELTLTDTANQAVARRILAPADYLPPNTLSTLGMQPNMDMMLAVGLDPDEVTASGYQLYLFYP